MRAVQTIPSSQKILPCWTSPYGTVREWKVELLTTTAAYTMSVVRGSSCLTPPEEPCELEYQYLDSIFATVVIGGVFSICACCMMCACLVKILTEDDGSDAKDENNDERVKRLCFPFCCFKSCSRSRKTRPEHIAKTEGKWWRSTEERIYEEDVEYTSEEYTDGDYTDEEDLDSKVLDIYTHGKYKASKGHVPETAVGGKDTMQARHTMVQ